MRRRGGLRVSRALPPGTITTSGVEAVASTSGLIREVAGGVDRDLERDLGPTMGTRADPGARLDEHRSLAHAADPVRGRVHCGGQSAPVVADDETDAGGHPFENELDGGRVGVPGDVLERLTSRDGPVRLGTCHGEW